MSKNTNTINLSLIDAITTSQSETRRALAHVGTASAGEVVAALHEIEDYIDRAEEDDGTWDVWGGEGADEWRIRIVFADVA